MVAESLPEGALKRLCSPLVVRILRAVLHEREFIEFGKAHPDARGFDLVDRVLEYFNFKYRVEPEQLARIPEAGRVVIVANHPVGSLDGLAFLHMIRRIRPDVKIVVNQILVKIEPLAPVLLPVDNMGGNTGKLQLRAIHKHLRKEGALIVFPSGVVSRLGCRGIRDGEWRSGFIKFSRVMRAPILPVHIRARNSSFFYLLSLVARKISTLWLVPEMFKLRGKSADFHIGKIVPCKHYESFNLAPRALAAIFRNEVYALRTGSKQIFPTHEPVAPAGNRVVLRKEIGQGELLGETSDGKQIFLFNYQPDSKIIAELGRLRELTFRMVEEGTGKSRDLDKYDQHYQHLLLWDKVRDEIVGAYRICDTARVIPELGQEGLYSSLIYRYTENMTPYFERGMELGRSFVQPRYWGKRSLDYLWYGIGALIRNNPQYRYLFGAVSLSDGYPDEAKDLIVHFYATHFPAHANLVEALHPYRIPKHKLEHLQHLFPGKDYGSEFTLLKKMLKKLNCTIPTLYKQYADLCEPGGVSICASGLDVTFSNVIDGFVMVDIWKLKPGKRERYLQGTLASAAQPGVQPAAGLTSSVSSTDRPS